MVPALCKTFTHYAILVLPTSIEGLGTHPLRPHFLLRFRSFKLGLDNRWQKSKKWSHQIASHGRRYPRRIETTTRGTGKTGLDESQDRDRPRTYLRSERMQEARNAAGLILDDRESGIF